MLRFQLSLPALSVLLLAAADSSWQTKTVAQWDENDAKQVLTGSPWVKQAIPTLLPQLTAEQRREGGATGGGKGIDFKRIGQIGLTRHEAAPRQSQSGRQGAVTIRWESALPVRVAEMKTHDIAAPEWDGDGYVVAVYGIPALDLRGKQKTMQAVVKKMAALKRKGKQDVKPVSVHIIEEPSGLAIVVYMFPASAQISMEDQCIEFVTQVDRLSIAQYFYTSEMTFLGKLEI